MIRYLLAIAACIFLIKGLLYFLKWRINMMIAFLLAIAAGICFAKGLLYFVK